MTGIPEVSLSGGHVTAVVRFGDTVRRVPSERGEFVHALLRHLEGRDWRGAPRFLGIDEAGREVLEYLDGQVAWEPPRPAAVTSDASLTRVAELVRELHDLTAGTSLAGGQEVVCHNDLSPRNTVYRDAGGGLRPVAFIDWDLAAPGRRIHDLAHTCWQFPDLGPGVADPSEAGRRVRLLCDAYGLDDRGEVVDTILWWQDRCWRGIEAGAARGDAPMVRLRDSGAAAGVRRAFDWVIRHRAEIEARL